MTLLYFFAVSLIFLKIGYTDFKEKYIYDRDLLLAAVIIMLHSIYNAQLINSLIGALAGFLIGYIIYAAAMLVYHEEAFGFGDVLLLSVLGMLLNWPVFIHYFCISIILTGFFFILVLLVNPNLRNLSIPFAPILIFWLPVFLTAGKPTIFKLFSFFCP